MLSADGLALRHMIQWNDVPYYEMLTAKTANDAGEGGSLTERLTRALKRYSDVGGPGGVSRAAPVLPVSNLISGITSDLQLGHYTHGQSRKGGPLLSIRPSQSTSQREGRTDFHPLPLNVQAPREYKEVHVLSMQWTFPKEDVSGIQEIPSEALEAVLDYNQLMTREELEKAYRLKLANEFYSISSSSVSLGRILTEGYFYEKHELWLDSAKDFLNLEKEVWDACANFCQLYGNDPDNLIIFHNAGHGEFEWGKTRFTLGPGGLAPGRVDFCDLLDLNHRFTRCDSLYILGCCHADGSVVQDRIHKDLVKRLPDSGLPTSENHHDRSLKTEVFAACKSSDPRICETLSYTSTRRLRIRYRKHGTSCPCAARC